MCCLRELLMPTVNRIANRLRPHLLPLLIMIIVAVAADVYWTAYQVNYSLDGAMYMNYAKSIQLGQGLSWPLSTTTTYETTGWLTGWPPLYVMMLSLGSNLIQWGRI